MIEFDFPGKDSIRYYNCVPVERQVFKNVRLFMKDKTDGDDLFDRLTVSCCCKDDDHNSHDVPLPHSPASPPFPSPLPQTASLNKHLAELVPKLTAKVFRTYNASKTLQEQLDELTVGECCTKLSQYSPSPLPSVHFFTGDLPGNVFAVADDTVASKMLSYNRANRAVAILCNHQVQI